LSWVESSNC